MSKSPTCSTSETAKDFRDDYFERSRTTGFIVLKNGTIVFQHYGYGANERSLIATASIAKSFVSTLVGLAIGDGLIGSVNDPISDYLQELKGTGYDGVPIKALLQMSSGTNWLEDYSASVSDFVHMWDESVQRNVTPITDFVRIAKPQVEPFSRWRYSAGDSIALGWLVSRVTGRTLSEYLSEKIWAPLGMEADANWVVDGPRATASEVAFCCLSATLRDYARFGLLLAQDGVWNGQRLLPEGWVRQATTPEGPQVQPGKLYPGYDVGYQYQWWTFPGPDHAFTARGVNGQFLYVNPGQNLVIVVTSAWPEYWNEITESHTYTVFTAFADRLR